MKKLLIVLVMLISTSVFAGWGLDINFNTHKWKGAKRLHPHIVYFEGVPDVVRHVAKKHLKWQDGKPVEMTAEEKQAVEDQLATARAEAIAEDENEMQTEMNAWLTAKNADNSVKVWENKFLEYFTNFNAMMLAEGKITEVYTVQELAMNEQAIGDLAVTCTNASRPQILLFLDQTSKKIEETVEKKYGTPPDGKPIIYYIQSH